MAGRIKLFSVLIISLAIDKFASIDFVPLGSEWDALTVTYGKFTKLPLTREEAESQGFQQIGGKDAPCEGTFSGYRYVKNDDPAIILLFDVNGYFAGTQTSFLEKDMTNSIVLAWFEQLPIYTVENLDLPGSNSKLKAYTLTAYLVNSTTICSTGRTKKEFDDNESGTNLYFINGTKIIAIPKLQKDLTGTPWKKANCFPSMGDHYYYEQTKDMNCDYLQPLCILYNWGKLTGFSFAALGNFSSPHYEHTAKSLLGVFFNPKPECLESVFDKVGGFSSLHIYLNDDPWNMIC